MQKICRNPLILSGDLNDQRILESDIAQVHFGEITWVFVYETKETL